MNVRLAARPLNADCPRTPSNTASGWPKISFRQRLELGDLAGLPGRVADEFLSEQGRDVGSGFHAGFRVEEQGAGATGEHVLDVACCLMAGCPDDLRGDVGQGSMKRFAQLGTLADQLVQTGKIGTVKSQVRWLTIGRFAPAVQLQ